MKKSFSPNHRGRWAARHCHLLCLLLVVSSAHGESFNLLERYPTKLTAGDARPENARLWEFAGGDIFQLSKFDLEIGQQLRVEIGPADLGIGHCADGAVWAVIIPRTNGILTSRGTSEEIASVWLRFHPKEINRLF